jgi:hypothetical protein
MKIGKIEVKIVPDFIFGKTKHQMRRLSVFVTSGGIVYNFQREVEEDDFEALFDRLMRMATEEIKGVIKNDGEVRGDKNG